MDIWRGVRKSAQVRNMAEDTVWGCPQGDRRHGLYEFGPVCIHLSGYLEFGGYSSFHKLQLDR